MTYDSEGTLSAKTSDPSNFIVSEAAVLQRSIPSAQIRMPRHSQDRMPANFKHSRYPEAGQYDTNRKLVEWRTVAAEAPINAARDAMGPHNS